MMWGLHVADWAVIGGYLVFLAVVAWRTSRRVKTSTDLYQGGRSLGKLLSTFLWFGTITDANQATGAAREVYNRGLQGVWFSNHVLFHTPFQWFLAVLQRRARYSAPGDLFLHRLESPGLAGFLAAFGFVMTFLAGGLGYQITGKTVEAVLRKPEAEYTAADRERISRFDRLLALKKKERFEPLSKAEEEEVVALERLRKRGEIASFASYLNLPVFYICFALVVAVYTMMGGLFAIAILDVLQALMILFLSIALLPLGLSAIGGFAGLHERLPERMFDLFGGGIDSEYPWHYVAAFTALILALNSPKNYTWGGSARDDAAAQVGFVTGSLAKRFVMVGWALAGLIGYAMYQGKVSDPTNVWGFMTADLLGAGFIGLMIVSIFCANMDGAAAGSSDLSAAIVKNLILLFNPGLSERRQLWIGRLLIVVILLGGIPSAIYGGDIVELFTRIISWASATGILVWVAFYWRRLTKGAVIAQIVCSVLVTMLLPWALPSAFPSMRRDPALTVMTRERVEVATEKALRSDVEEGRAAKAGDPVEKRRVARSVSVYFEGGVEQVPERDGADAKVPEGQGNFRVHLWLLFRLGIDFTGFTGPELKTVGCLFDLCFPLVILFSVSLFTRRSSEAALRRFYACTHTPCVPDPAEDARNVQRAVDDPSIVERDKLFPGTDWEFSRWTRRDVVGVGLSCAGVAAVIVCYVMVVRIGA